MPKAEETQEPRVVITEAAEAVRWDEESPPQQLWVARWETAELEFGGTNEFGGMMQNVAGELFDQSKTASRFAAKRAQATKTSGELVLTGSVSVTSLERQTKMTCDTVRYATKGKRIISASGRIKIEGDWGVIDGLQEVLATPGLKRFGTPAEFEGR